MSARRNAAVGLALGVLTLGLIVLGLSAFDAGLPEGPGTVVFVVACLVGWPVVAVLWPHAKNAPPRGRRGRWIADLFPGPPSTAAPPPGPTALELVRRRLRGEKGPGRTADEQVVRGRLRGARVSVRARLRQEQLVPDEATCSVEASIPEALHGPLTPERCPGVDPGLLAECGDARATRAGLEATVRRADVSALLRCLSALVAVAAALRTDPVADPEPPRLLRLQERSRRSCPYCRDDLLPDVDEAVACESCGTVHHATCFEEHGGCTALGCKQKRSRPLDSASPTS